MYSKRKGTIAEKMDNQIPIATKRERIHELLKIEHDISEQLFKEMIGTTQRVLIESGDDAWFIAKAQCGKVVKILNDVKIKIGTFVDVNIIDYTKGNLIGKINGNGNR